MTQLSRCQAHGLHFDPTLTKGCILCVKSASSASTTNASFARVVAIGLPLSVALAVLVVLARMLWSGDSKERGAEANALGAPSAFPRPRETSIARPNPSFLPERRSRTRVAPRRPDVYDTVHFGGRVRGGAS